MTTLSITTLSNLGYYLPEETVPMVQAINRADAGTAEAQAAIDDYAATLDAELSDSGHYVRGDMLGGQACEAAGERVIAAVTAIYDAME